MNGRELYENQYLGLQRRFLVSIDYPFTHGCEWEWEDEVKLRDR